MEKQSLLEKLQIITAYYGSHNVLDSNSTLCEYQCFSLLTNDLLTSNTRLKNMFPNLAKVAVIALIIHMSTADSERGHSTLGRIKIGLHQQTKL